MKMTGKLLLPLLVAGSVGMGMQAVQAGTDSYRIAATDYDKHPGIGDTDLNNNGKTDINLPDRKDSNTTSKTDNNDNLYNSKPLDSDGRNKDPGMASLGDNVDNYNDRNDPNDTDPKTFDATFWMLLTLLAVGIVAMIMAAARKRSTVH
ncbi:MAG: hypothetical protein ACAI44_28600 [Candidatus Sericytochromatia bacterium]